jgi:hypothetical protein
MTTHQSRKDLSTYWREKIAAWEQGNQSQKSFCQQHDLNYHRFGYWRRKLQSTKSVDMMHHPGGFVSVQLAPERMAGGLVLVLPNGIRVQGIESGNLPVVSQLLKQL